MSTTPFDHFCTVLDGTDKVDNFKTLNDTWKMHTSKK